MWPSCRYEKRDMIKFQIGSQVVKRLNRYGSLKVWPFSGVRGGQIQSYKPSFSHAKPFSNRVKQKNHRKYFHKKLMNILRGYKFVNCSWKAFQWWLSFLSCSKQKGVVACNVTEHQTWHQGQLNHLSWIEMQLHLNPTLLHGMLFANDEMMVTYPFTGIYWLCFLHCVQTGMETVENRSKISWRSHEWIFTSLYRSMKYL